MRRFPFRPRSRSGPPVLAFAVRSPRAGTQARRTAHAHAMIVLTVTALVVVDIGLWRPDADHSSPAVVGLSVAAVVLTALGSTFGGSMVFDYGFNVGIAGDSPVWRRSEDLLPGHRASPSTVTAAEGGRVEPAPGQGEKGGS
jgi:hypothetical protein